MTAPSTGSRRLTEAGIQRIKPPASGRLAIADAVVPGLWLRITTNDARSWSVMFRVPGRPAAQRLTVGRWPAIGVAEARQLAREVLLTVERGDDPAARKREQRNQVDSRFETVAAEFVERVLKPRQRRWQATAAVLDNRLTKPWRGRDIASIKKVDVLRVLDRQMDAGQHRSANVALQLARRLFRWSLERDYIAVDPTAGIAKPGKEQARSRVLDDNELAAVLRASEAMGWPFGPFVTLLAMLAQRRGELAQARWQHFDFERQVWNIPAELTKSHRAHQVPLPPEAVAILESLPRLDGNEYLFPAVRDRLQDGRKRSVSGFSRAKARLHQLSGVKGWSYHDLRRSAASGMAKQGAAPHVLAAVLNHDQRSVQGVTSIYNRERYRTEMRRALELWCNHVGTLMADERSNVIPIGA